MFDKRNRINLSQLKADLLHILNGFVDMVSKRTKGTGDIFVNIMLKVAIIKIALGIVALMAMTTLYFLHLRAFEPITIRFSKWASSPLIGFIISILIVKFVAISVCLTVLIVKKATIETMLLRLKGFKTFGLPVIGTRKKARLQLNIANQ